MTETPRKITLDEWDRSFETLQLSSSEMPSYWGCLGRHVADGDHRLLRLSFDNSPAALRLWNFLLTEEDRLFDAKLRGKKIIGTMKDLGTIPVMVYSFENAIAFYPDGAWWTPCIMEGGDGLFAAADAMGFDDSFCPVRAVLGAFKRKDRFPIPDMLICSVGATCDDFSAVAQRIEVMGHEILWWEVPHRRWPERNEPVAELPGGEIAPRFLVEIVREEIIRIKSILERCVGEPLDDMKLRRSIQRANIVRSLIHNLRRIVFMAPVCPLPALELQIAEMLALHFCSDYFECVEVLKELLVEVESRVAQGWGFLTENAVKVFWVNPVADLKIMNLLEDCGGRLCGTDFMFTHSLDLIPEDVEPLEALARMALADPMVGSAHDRARRIIRDAQCFGAEALIVSRIPGASHCAYEGEIIKESVPKELEIPVVEIETASITDASGSAIQTRIEALIENARQKRTPFD
ncbi:MAG TPA: 2-hydroxyacyl-CoA dehydratase family protein [Candidatus Sumerlaeota bacterium]|nr:2-hydroxyacyl-CoA dehydratase family protein [Candidatus Sumerlaeota bacterium]